MNNITFTHKQINAVSKIMERNWSEKDHNMTEEHKFNMKVKILG